MVDTMTSDQSQQIIKAQDLAYVNMQYMPIGNGYPEAVKLLHILKYRGYARVQQMQREKKGEEEKKNSLYSEQIQHKSHTESLTIYRQFIPPPFESTHNKG